MPRKINYPALKAELDANYAAATDAEARDALNAKTLPRASITGDEARQATDETEFDGLTTDLKNMWLTLCNAPTLYTGAGMDKQVVIVVFGGGRGPNTIAALQALRDNKVAPREQIADLNYSGELTLSHIANARAGVVV